MKTSSDYKLLSKLYFRLLPYQALLLLINAANGIVDSLFASNFIGTTAMSAIGFYSPLTHFLFSISIMLVSGSQLLVGKVFHICWFLVIKRARQSIRRALISDGTMSCFVSRFACGRCSSYCRCWLQSI